MRSSTILPRRRVGTRSENTDSPPAATDSGACVAPVATASRSQRGGAPWVCERNPEYGVVARKRRLGAGCARNKGLEVAVAGMHRADAERGEQEGEREAHVVCVVERAQQHREEHHAECGAKARRKDVDASAPQCHGTAIGSLATADPVRTKRSRRARMRMWTPAPRGSAPISGARPRPRRGFSHRRCRAGAAGARRPREARPAGPRAARPHGHAGTPRPAPTAAAR